MPGSTCCRTTSVTALRTSRSSGWPCSLCRSSGIGESSRARLHTWVVRTLSAVRFLIFFFSIGAALSKAQKEADAKGYIFVAAHEEIVSKAKQEGKVRVIVSTDGGLLKHLTAGFKKKYPFIDIRADELRGTDAYIRQLHEIKGGLVKGQDVNDLAYDYYD